MFLTIVILFCLAIFFTIVIFSVSGILYDLNIVFTATEVFISLYLSFMSQLNVGCFIMGSLIWVLHSVLCWFLQWLQVWPVSLSSLLQLPFLLCSFACSFAIFYILCLLISAYMRQWLFLCLFETSCLCMPIRDFYSWQPVVFLALVKKTLLCLYTYLLLYVHVYKNAIIYMCAYLYIQWWCTLPDHIQDTYWLL